MKYKSFLIILFVFYINNCRMPSNPNGEITIVKRIDIIDTGGNCLDVDVDIQDSILVVAANYNGYFIYELISNNGMIAGINTEKIIHVSADEMFVSQGDNRSQTVTLSKYHDIAFVMDKYDHVWLYKYGEGASQYIDNFLDESNCYGGTWLSVAIDDQLEKVGVYALLKHNTAEEEGANYLEYSTSLVWTNLESVDASSTSLDGNSPDCEYITNQDAIAEKIYFNDGILSMAYGELGMKIFQQTDVDVCSTVSELIDLQNDSFCLENHENSGDINYERCCESTSCPGGIGQCPWIAEEGYGGIFSSAGGILPQNFVEFDTPGEVEAIYSKENAIFSGLSNSNGCILTTLDNDATIISSIQFAIGYTINGIHQDDGLIALAAGHDGVLLYEWNLDEISFMGKIDTPYANSIKVSGDVIFVATEDGLEIIQID